MSDERDDHHDEIVIVRRGGDGDEDGHHGGVWKIAYADFMTAMMCFFLVMWLINAANEETRVAVASYFNPVKLTDRSTNRKGLDDAGKGPQNANIEESPEKASDQPVGSRDENSGPQDNQHSAERDEQRRFSDENLFSDPYAVLAEIAAETGELQNVSDKGEGGAQLAGPSSGASGGDSYRDPFAPDFWSQQVETPRDGVQGDPDEARENPLGGDVRALETGPYHLSPDGDVLDDEIAALYEPVPPVEPVEPQAPAEAADSGPSASERLAEEIGAELASALAGEPISSGVTVAPGDSGVLISITDDIAHGMFPIGSAVPRRDLVVAMEKIGRTLAGRRGQVRINGHTDGRPFRSADYDNWRLSTARAHAAYYMLVRGGLDEARVTEVAGFADRRLKLPDEPYADANRRIEILLEVPE